MLNETIDTPPITAVDEARPTRWAWVILLALILMTAGGLRLVLTPLQEAAKHDLHFTDLQIGMLQGFAKGLPIAVFALPVGLAIDHLDRTRVMLFLALCWTSGTILTAFSYSFEALFAARMLVGLGSGSALAVAMSIIADLCAPHRRGRVLLVAGIGAWTGTALAFALGGALFGYFSTHGWSFFPDMAAWRLTTLAFGIFGVAMLIPIAMFREPERHEREQRNNAMLPALKGLLSRWRFLVPLFLGQMAGGMAEGASGIWAAPVLQRQYGLTPDQFGGWMGGMILVSGILGSVLGGVSADWGQNSSRRGGIMIGAVVATAFTIPAAAYPVMPNVAWFGLALGVLLLGCTVAQLVGLTAVTVLIPNEERGVCMAIIGVIGTVVGLGTAPLVAELGTAVLGSEERLPEALALVGVATGVLALAGYVITMLAAPARRAAAA
ncbi:MFS transporter [Stakelama sp. CBK3Z-3]|uniref:MFS transporter n=1 Tax=Stakelama flava TaxID=2860338 RepID=A0ABS6XIB7_9SPHN|nr:MFS transporter [Stakelama flava]MBW4329930.1 MFS transporter [Stakelama flava]